MFDLGIFEISLKDFNNPIISVGEASGKNALKDAVQNAIEGRDFIKLEKGFAIFIKIPPGITSVFEIEAALKIFQDAIPEDAEIIWDVMSDESLVDKVKVLIIAEKSIA